MFAFAANALSIALSFGATIIAASVQQATPGPEATLETARWAIGRSGQMCALRRQLAASPAVTLIVRSFPGSGEYELLLVSPEWSRTMARGQRGARLVLVPSGTHYERPDFFTAAGGEFGNGVRFAALPASFISEMAELTALTLTVGDRQIGTYSVPLAARAAQAFSECETARLAEWGADPAGLEAGATRPQPIGEQGRWLRPQDLSVQANVIRLVLRLSVEADGRALQCAVIESTVSAGHAESACNRLIDRARYEPGRDARGNAVPSVAIYHVEWIRTPNVR